MHLKTCTHVEGGEVQDCTLASPPREIIKLTYAFNKFKSNSTETHIIK